MMSLIRHLRPGRTAETVLDIDYGQLRAEGKRAVLFDLDNTLERGRPSTLRPDTVDFLRHLKDSGLLVGILSNRRGLSEGRIARLSVAGVPMVLRAGKPRRAGYLRLMRSLGVSAVEAVFVGDRRVTDVLGANRVGLDTILVRSPAFSA